MCLNGYGSKIPGTGPQKTQLVKGKMSPSHLRFAGHLFDQAASIQASPLGALTTCEDSTDETGVFPKVVHGLMEVLLKVFLWFS